MGYHSQVYIKLTNERMPQLYSILLEHYNDPEAIGLYAHVVVELEGFHFDNINMQNFIATNHPEALL